jgi:hypothetical protein
MVDLVTLQTISYMAGALGVCLAALSFVFNMRASAKSRNVALFTNVMQTLNSEEGWRKYLEVMSMEWTDLEDYKRKYDSSINFENFIKRIWFWELGDYIGWQYRTGIVDMETIYSLGGKKLVSMWFKFKPIIYEFKKTSNFEPDDFVCWGEMSEAYTRWVKDDPLVAEYRRIGLDAAKSQ